MSQGIIATIVAIYSLGLFAVGALVGWLISNWHWSKYIDWNDTDEEPADLSRRSSEGA